VDSVDQPPTEEAIAPATHRRATPRHGATKRLRARDERLGWMLDETDSFVYFSVGAAFFLAAVVSLSYGLVRFGYSIWALSQAGLAAVSATNQIEESVVNLLSNLLLTLIVLEIMGTVIHYLRMHTTTLKPFLIIGIISAIRGILAVGARLTINAPQGEAFLDAIIELGVSAGVIIALAIALRLVGQFLSDSATVSPPSSDRAAEPR
jgi:uncharacterized membrane protein (DUF373 family)